MKNIHLKELNLFGLDIVDENYLSSSSNDKLVNENNNAK